MTKWHLGAIKMIPEWLSFHNLFMSFIPEWRLYGIHMIKSNGLACKVFSLGWFSHQIRYAYATFPRLHNFWNELIPEWLVGEWNVVLVPSKQIQRNTRMRRWDELIPEWVILVSCEKISLQMFKIETQSWTQQPCSIHTNQWRIPAAVSRISQAKSPLQNLANGLKFPFCVMLI